MAIRNELFLGRKNECRFLVLADFRSVTPQNWEDFSRYNKERADAEMKASTTLREAIHHTLHKTENDLDAQKGATEYAYRKRLHETEQAKEELEWQKANVSTSCILDLVSEF